MASSSIPLDSSLAGSTRDTADAPEGGQSWRWEVIRPYAGWGLAVLGAVFIVVGWIGISGESLVAKQMPYLISGGVGGVAPKPAPGPFLSPCSSALLTTAA